MLFIIINIIWFFKTPYKREKKQALILLISFFTSVLCLTLYMVLAFHTFKWIKYVWVGSERLFFVFWSIGFWYCLTRYRLLALTPDLVSKDIISRIDEMIILINMNGDIVTANEKTKKLLGCQNVNNRPLSLYIPQYNQVKHEIDELIKSKAEDFSCRCNFITHENENILVDIKVSLVNDRFGDPMGVLLIGREVKEIKQLKAVYKITDREAQIIQDIIAGRTNIEIAHNLDISENTLKRHITNIYNKLCVGNKIQLLNLLKDFNLIPDRKADKTVLILKKRKLYGIG